MPVWAWVIIGVGVALALLLVAGLLASRRRRQRQSEELRGQFGPEYERATEERGRREGEQELAERLRKRAQLRIVPLSAQARELYLARWNELQMRFVDSPPDTLEDAQQLVTDVMSKRGYPMDDFEQRADDVSVDHPDVVENYRAAHRIFVAHRRGEADTERQRQALVHYRALFADLLETDEETVGSEAAVGREDGRK